MRRSVAEGKGHGPSYLNMKPQGNFGTSAVNTEDFFFLATVTRNENERSSDCLAQFKKSQHLAALTL